MARSRTLGKTSQQKRGTPTSAAKPEHAPAPDPYRIDVPRSVAKELDALVARDFEAVRARIEALKGAPRPPGAQKLTGRSEMKLRVGNLRIVYEVDDAARKVRLVTVDDRKRVYKRLARR